MGTTGVAQFEIKTHPDGVVHLAVGVVRTPAPYRGPSAPDVADLPTDFIDALRRWVGVDPEGWETLEAFASGAAGFCRDRALAHAAYLRDGTPIPDHLR